MVVVGDRIHGQDLIGWRGTPWSNHDRWLRIGRWLLWFNSVGDTEVDRCHGCQLGQAQAQATLHGTWWGLTLHDVEDKGNPFCKLTLKETVEGERAMAERFSRCLAMARVASDNALPCSSQAPPWVNCFAHWWIKVVRQLSSCARVWGL
jgi:hypothetical protein